MSARTPGPWHKMIDSTGEYYAVYAMSHARTKVICPVKIADEADAHLIAAAPELLAVLKAIADEVPTAWGDHVVDGRITLTLPEGHLDSLFDSLEKAEGRS